MDGDCAEFCAIRIESTVFTKWCGLFFDSGTFPVFFDKTYPVSWSINPVGFLITFVLCLLSPPLINIPGHVMCLIYVLLLHVLVCMYVCMSCSSNRLCAGSGLVSTLRFEIHGVSTVRSESFHFVVVGLQVTALCVW